EEQGYFCEYWISPNFQTCLKLKESLTKTNVFLLEGRYYERELLHPLICKRVLCCVERQWKGNTNHN
ncbi:unnamed protein product, partial [Ectocarpus sp. 12 AP-2014]